MSLLPMNTYEMAQFCHKTTNFSPDIEELDIKIANYNENIEDLENIIIRRKLKMRNIDLKNAQYKLRAQEREIRSLRDCNKQINKEGGVDNEEPGVCHSETLFDIERNNACLHTSYTKENADVSAQNQSIDNLIEETRSLKRIINNKDIEISQLRFRSKLLVDTLKERKLGKDNKFYTSLDENEFLQEQMAFLKEDNLKKDEELSKVIFDLKRAQERNAHITTENCTLNVKLTEHERQIIELEETIKHVKFLKDEVQRALMQSLQKEVELKGTLLQLNDKDKETENKIHTMTNRLKRYIGIIHDNEAELERLTGSWQRKIQQLEARLEQSHQDVIKGKEQANIAQERMSKEMANLKIEMNGKDNEIARLEQINTRYEKVRSTLNESQEKEVTFRKTIKELQKKSQENENRLSEIDKTSEESHKIEYELKETIQLLNQKNKRIETEKDQYKQDIANAKHLSKAAQMKMSEMDTRINDLTNKLKKKEEDLQKGKENLRGIIDSQKDQIQHLEREVQKRERKMKSVQIEKDNELQEMKKNVVELENQMKHMLSKLHDKEAELDETKSRLSRVMGDRLTDNKPNITDLSDRNRPTKIAEKCAELYDIERKDAFDVLEKLYRTEESAIEALLLILQNAMHFCETMAQRQIEFIEREMYFADEKEKIIVSSDIQKLIKDRRKATATAVVGNLKKIYVAQLKQSKDQIMIAALDVEPYTSECIEICWLMLIQDPPVVFAPLPIKGSSFDTNFYKPYTKSGTHIDFAVWPSLLLHYGGPILAKGMAQGYENN